MIRLSAVTNLRKIFERTLFWVPIKYSYHGVKKKNIKTGKKFYFSFLSAELLNHFDRSAQVPRFLGKKRMKSLWWPNARLCNFWHLNILISRTSFFRSRTEENLQKYCFYRTRIWLLDFYNFIIVNKFLTLTWPI